MKWYTGLILYHFKSNLLISLWRHGYTMHDRGPYDIIDLCIRTHGPANHKRPLLSSPFSPGSSGLPSSAETRWLAPLIPRNPWPLQFPCSENLLQSTSQRMAAAEMDCSETCSYFYFYI
jgi:hypothetical protein